MEGHRGGWEAVPKRVRLVARDAETNLGILRADGPSRLDGRRAVGGNLCPLDSTADDRLHGGAQQLVLSREAQSLRVPDGGIHDGHALSRRQETQPRLLLTH